MQSLWQEPVNAKDDLDIRVHSSRIIGMESDLVLHGGGNTSVKSTVKNLFGEEEEILYVKGSGWDLATIERAGFAPVRMDTLIKLSKLELETQHRRSIAAIYLQNIQRDFAAMNAVWTKP